MNSEELTIDPVHPTDQAWIEAWVIEQWGSSAVVAHGQVYYPARLAGCRRIWLITTNDNLNALRFYQKRGYRLVRVDPGAVDRSRLLKPEIPATGEFGIPIRDEIELEKKLWE